MRPLTDYVALITDAYPDLPVHSARLHTDDGQFNVIIFLNEDLVFRFPRNAHVAEAYSGQVDLLRWLTGRLPLAIPTPSFESPRDVGWGARFFGYRRIAGEPLDAVALAGMGAADRDAVATQLATFLRALHQNTAADLPVGIPASHPLAEWEPRVAGMREQLFPHMRPDARRWADAHLTSGLALLRAIDAPLALRHGDFGGGNILYDPRARRVSGVIDFEFAGLGDPATDVAALSTYGEEFFAHCLRIYPEMEALRERAAFYRGTFALQEAYYGLRDGDEAAFASGMAQYR